VRLGQTEKGSIVSCFGGKGSVAQSPSKSDTTMTLAVRIPKGSMLSCFGAKSMAAQSSLSVGNTGHTSGNLEMGKISITHWQHIVTTPHHWQPSCPVSLSRRASLSCPPPLTCLPSPVRTPIIYNSRSSAMAIRQRSPLPCLPCLVVS